MNCSKCGKNLIGDAKFCISCGKPVQKVNVSTLTDEIMSAKIQLKLEIYRQLKPNAYRKPLNVVLDNRIVRNIDWGEEIEFEIPAGKHSLIIQAKYGLISNTLNIESKDGDILHICCGLHSSMSYPAKLFLFKEKDRASLSGMIMEHHRDIDYKFTGRFICIIGIANLVYAFLTLNGNLPILGENLVPLEVISGVIFLVLGILLTKKSRLALLITTLAFILSSWNSFKMIPQGGSLVMLFLLSFIGAGFLSFVLIIFLIIEGIRVIKT